MTPLFIVGAPRSGTTLTRTLLQGFSNVYLLPDEFQILPRFLAEIEDGASPERLVALTNMSVFAGHMRRRGIWPDEDSLLNALSQSSPAETFKALVLAIAFKDERDKIEIWGDKTPENVFHLDMVTRLWPDAKVLYVQRDPRSTVLSMSRSWGRSLSRGAVIWRDAQRAADAFSKAYPDRFHCVKFEDLTAAPSAEMDRVGAWLNVLFDHGTLADVFSEERWGRAAGTVGVQRQRGDWAEALSQKGIRLIEEICFDEMQSLGIDTTLATFARAPNRMSLKAAKVADSLKVLYAYSRERGLREALSYKFSQWRFSR
jgi:hypothetical protein